MNAGSWAIVEIAPAPPVRFERPTTPDRERGREPFTNRMVDRHGGCQIDCADIYLCAGIAIHSANLGIGGHCFRLAAGRSFATASVFGAEKQTAVECARLQSRAFRAPTNDPLTHGFVFIQTPAKFTPPIFRFIGALTVAF
jgi:hypothetical protein